MYTVHEKKKDNMILVIDIDQTKIAQGHGYMQMPKSQYFKDKRKSTKTTQRIQFKKDLSY